MVTETEERAYARRKLMLRDGIAFLTLLAVTGALFGLTLLLFRSFTTHRDELARRWADRGAESMRAGEPEQAIVALRTALNYAPDNRTYELLLAQALGEAGLTDESYAYFMTLWEAQPGSGFINLELARLAAKRGDRTAAVEFYRASIYGTWEGDGVARRAEVRLELARYLISLKQYDAGRMELLIAAGNAPESAQLDLAIGALLAEAQDQVDARKSYDKAAALAPRDADVLAQAGRFAYEQGDFLSAHRLLARAEAERSESRRPADADLAKMGETAARLAELLPAATLPAGENAARMIALRKTAKKRLDACTAELAAPGPGAALGPVVTRWSAREAVADAASLRDTTTMQAALRLVYDTELATQKVCSAPQGGDALLLVAAHRAPAVVAGNQTTNPAEAPATR